MEEKRYTVQEVCRLFGGISRDTLYRWINDRGFPCHQKAGKRKWFLLPEMEKWRKAEVRK